MSTNVLSPEGPAPESYSRVTNASRFHPLHHLAVERMRHLESAFDVRRTEPYDLDPDLASVDAARVALRVQPNDPSAAPIAVAFTTFPGILVRSGRWTLQAFPACGCDACAETLEGESERFFEWIESVVAGRFHESISIPLVGAAKQEWKLWSADSSRGGGRRLERAHARQLVAGGARSLDWRPWRARKLDEGTELPFPPYG